MNNQNVLLGSLGGLVAGANAGKILQGIGCGVVSIILAFVLIFYTVNGVQENSVEVANLPLQEASELSGDRGPVKVYGQMQVAIPLTLDVASCTDLETNTFCTEPDSELELEDLVYYSVKYQRFEVVREVDVEEEENGDRTEKVSYENEWVTKSFDEQWAEVTLDGIAIDPDDARKIIEFEDEEIENAFIADLTNFETYGRTPAEDEPAFGTTRAVVTYLPVDNREYVIVGENRSTGISSGSPFVITDKSESELVAQLGGEETTLRWGLRFVAFLMLTFGFTSVLSPILVFTDLIPLAGGLARGAATFVAGLLSFVIVLATVFLLNFWWLIAILIIVGVGAAVAWGLMQKRKEV